jgi:hypothetical protein
MGKKRYDGSTTGGLQWVPENPFSDNYDYDKADRVIPNANQFTPNFPEAKTLEPGYKIKKNKKQTIA